MYTDMENIREIVLDTLITLEKEEEFSHRLIKSVLDKYDYLDSRDKAFIKRVTEGTIERRLELDYYLNHYSSVPVRKMKPLIRCLLRMSVYQILYMDAVPDSAVCNEACKLAQKRKFQNLKGFVNAVLRKISKEKDKLPYPDKEKEYTLYLSVKYSMPEWLIKLWQEQFGELLTEKILKGLLAIHPVSVRFSEKLSEKEIADCVSQMSQRNTVLIKSRYLDRVYLAKNMDNPENMPGYEDGMFTIQDVSSVLALKAMGITQNDVVMDVCAAPGGKSILAAELAKEVYSSDVSEIKVDRMQENVDRMKCENIHLRVQDAREFDPAFENKADVLILDVPCSGLGILGKKRDIKYHVTKEGLESITQLQKEIVEGCYRYVKPGGILMYSTCTVREEENSQMVSWILDNLPFEPVAISDSIPGKLREDILKTNQMRYKETDEVQKKNTDECFVQLFPGVMESDGFFFAKLRRK